MTQPAKRIQSRRILATGGVLLLLGSMIGLGLLSNRPAPPRSPDDPQPLLHLFRRGNPAHLLDSLPLQVSDQVRFFGEIPPDLKATFFLVEPSGEVREWPAHFVQRVGITGLMTDHVIAPASENEQLPIGKSLGTRLYLLCASRHTAPGKELLQPLLRGGSWPVMPPQVMMRLTRTKFGPICSRGAKLPDPETLKAIEERLLQLAEQLRGKVDFYAGVAVQVK